MKNIFIILLSVLCAYSCSVEQPEGLLGTTDERAGIMRSSAAMLAVGDSVVIEVTLMNIGGDTCLNAISATRDPAHPFMLTGGEFGYGYKSDADGDTWTLSYAGAHFQGPSHTINALSWARSVNYNNWRTCIVACNKELWYYDGIGGGWNSLLIGDEYKFTATTNYIDPRGWAAFWHIAGLKNGIPCLYYYYYFQGGTYIYFHELDASMFENKITDMTNMYGQPVIAVTAGGEVATTGSSPGDFFEIVYDCDTALYATCLFYTERSDSTKIFVAGDNGFMKYAITTDQSTWFSINSSGITSRINTMATDCDEDGAGGSILVAGGNGGQFSYSLDEGQTFIPYDIGFGTANINDITYYPHDNSFYAVGEHGKIARIKFTLE